MVQRSIGPYEVIREIAEDRLGQVFEAVDPKRKKHVIIKSLRREAASRPEVLSRLYSEARTLALLNHPHIARIFGFIRVHENVYLVMEFVAGESLRSILKEKGRLDPNLALAIFCQIVAAVKFAHELGVIHGDLKPANIMVSSFGQSKVLNFAIAPILGDLDIVPQGIGSAPYVAPERITRGPVDNRSDIYSLGALLYECIVGRVPFIGNTREEIQRAASKSTLLPPSLIVSNCPGWLDAFLLRALAATPNDRFRSVAAMSQAMGPAAPIRNKSSAAKPLIGSIRQVVERASPMPSVLSGGARRMFAGLATNLHSAIRIAQQKTASATRSLHTAAGSLLGTGQPVNPRLWTKQAAGKIQPWTRIARLQFRRLSLPALRVPERLKERLTEFAEGNWKRYIVLATLLVSVLIETFIFGGANTLLNPGFNSIPALNNGGAQSILEPLNPPPATSEFAPVPAPQPTAAKRVNRAARTSEPTNASSDKLHHEALNSRRTVTYRDTEDHSSRPVLQDARVSEPAKRNPENNTPKVQLNVKWEN